jgi:hypothetical protein
MLCNRHKIYQRIYFIYSNIDSFSDEEFLYLMNNWDKELVQFKLRSEVNCTNSRRATSSGAQRGDFGYHGVGY